MSSVSKSTVIDQLVNAYNEKHSGSRAKKALTAIESRIKQISSECLQLQKDMDSGIEALSRGKQPVADHTQIVAGINLKKTELVALKNQLAFLSKYSKAGKLADKVLDAQQQLEKAETRQVVLDSAHKTGLEDVYVLKGEIRDLVRAASKDKKNAGTLLTTAVEKYQQLEGKKESQKPEVVRTIALEQEALRKQLVVVARKTLPLSRSEKKLETKYRIQIEYGRALTEKQKSRNKQIGAKVVLSQLYFSEDSEKETSLKSKVSIPDVSKSISTDGTNISLQYVKISEEKGRQSLQDSLSGEKISTKEKKVVRVKVSTYQKIRHRRLSKTAKLVEKRGIECLKAQSFLENAERHLRTDSDYKPVVVQTQLHELDKLIVESEKVLADLQEKIADRGTSKLATRIDQAIVQNRNLLASLHKKRESISVIAEQKYHGAIQSQTKIMKAVDASIKNEKVAGYQLHTAYTELEKIAVLKEKSKEPLKYEIALVHDRMANYIEAARLEGKLKLTSHKSALVKKLLAAKDNGRTLPKLIKSKGFDERISIVISKKIVDAVFTESKDAQQRSIKVAEIKRILHKIQKSDLAKLRSILQREELKPVFDRFAEEFSEVDSSEFLGTPKDQAEAFQQNFLNALNKKNYKLAQTYLNRVTMMANTNTDLVSIKERMERMISFK